jgi:hypothetical protein
MAAREGAIMSMHPASRPLLATVLCCLGCGLFLSEAPAGQPVVSNAGKGTANAPNVTRTPTPGGPVPVPYPNVTKPPTAQAIRPSPVTVRPIATKPDVLQPGTPRAIPDLQSPAGKDVRQDRSIESRARTMEPVSRARKLDLDNRKLDTGAKEAGRRFDAATDQADAEAAMGIVQGSSQIGGAVRPPDASPGGASDDVESQVMTVLMEADQDNRDELRRQTKETREANAARRAVRKTPGQKRKDGIDSQIEGIDDQVSKLEGRAEKIGKVSGKTETILPKIKPDEGEPKPADGASGKPAAKKQSVAVAAEKPGAAAAKPTLTARPCTPINPC